MRRLLAVTTAIAMGLTPAASHAREDDADLRAFLSLDFTGATFTPHLGPTHLSGEGTPKGGGPRASFDVTGAQLGVVSPTFHAYGGGLTAGLWFAYLACHFDFARVHADAAPGDPTIAALYDRTEVRIFRGSFELGAQVWAFGLLRLAVGALLGGENVTVPIPTYETIGARGRGTTHVTTGSFLFEPRVSMSALVGEESGVALGGYVGTPLAGGNGVEVGFTVGVGLRLPFEAGK